MKLSVDGTEIHAATGGKEFDPALPSVVFLHGAGMDHTVWALQSRYFAHHGFGVLAVDWPGHGRSGGEPIPSIAEQAAWVTRLLDAAKVEKAALVGHSMGGLAAIETAARFPGRVSAVALCGVAEAMPVHPDLLAAAQAGEHLAYDLVVNWGYGGAAQLGGHPAPGYWMTGAGMRLLERDRYAIGADFAACNDYGKANGAAAKVGCPALFVLGDGDKMTPLKSGRALAAEIEGSRVAVISDCGHMMMVERPDATLDALRDFLATVEA